jgi:hypothetical protein
MGAKELKAACSTGRTRTLLNLSEIQPIYLEDNDASSLSHREVVWHIASIEGKCHPNLFMCK